MTPGRAALECELIGSRFDSRMKVTARCWNCGSTSANTPPRRLSWKPLTRSCWWVVYFKWIAWDGTNAGVYLFFSRSTPNTRRNPTQRASTENTTVNSSCQRVSTPSRSGHHSAKTVSSLWTPHCQFQLWPVAKHWYQSSTKPISIIFMDVNKTNNLWLNWMELILLFSINLI